MFNLMAGMTANYPFPGDAGVHPVRPGIVVSLVVVTFIFAASPTRSQAQLVVTVGLAADATSLVDAPLGPFLPGGTVTVPFFAHISDDVTPSELTTYSFPIDLGADGEGIPSSGATSFFSNFPIGPGGAGGPDSAVGGNLSFAQVTGFMDLDFLAEWNGSVDLSRDPSAPTLLFELTFDVDAATPPGVFDITIPAGFIAESQTSFNSNSIPLTNLSFDDGQFAIADANTIAGDFNGDGVVQASDYVIFRDTVGQAVPPGTGADGNGDGVISPQDFDVFVDNFNSTVGSAAVRAFAVPEPSSLALLAAASFSLYRRRRH